MGCEMATSTDGGTTTSFSNTPQAGDDLFTGLNEDSSSSSIAVIFNVMANDLGGNAKTLWSIDNAQSAGGAAPVDLLTVDSARTEALSNDTSLWGAKIWITADGKVAYDASTMAAAFKAQLQSLAAGEIAYDKFTYAIRLGNGTLSWATAQIQYVGVNDATTVSAHTDAAVTEDLAPVAGKLVDTGTITFKDVDNTDTHTVAVVNVTNTLGGALTAKVTDDSTGDGTGAVTTDSSLHTPATPSLAEGKTAPEPFPATIDEKKGGPIAQSVTVPVPGVNDPPEAKPAAASPTKEAPAITVTADFTDPDLIDT